MASIASFDLARSAFASSSAADAFTAAARVLLSSSNAASALPTFLARHQPQASAMSCVEIFLLERARSRSLDSNGSAARRRGILR